MTESCLSWANWLYFRKLAASSVSVSCFKPAAVNSCVNCLQKVEIPGRQSPGKRSHWLLSHHIFFKRLSVVPGCHTTKPLSAPYLMHWSSLATQPNYNVANIAENFFETNILPDNSSFISCCPITTLLPTNYCKWLQAPASGFHTQPVATSPSLATAVDPSMSKRLPIQVNSFQPHTGAPSFGLSLTDWQTDGGSKSYKIAAIRY